MKLYHKALNVREFDEVTGFNFGMGILGPPVMTAWCYLLDGILIDTGITRLHRQVMETLVPFSPSVILLTHHHEDHSGNAGPLSRALGIPVYGREYTARKLKQSYPILPYQHLMWGKAFPANVKPFPETIVSDSGTYSLTPIHTPGHSKDHSVFHEPNRGWLFSGDLFLGEKIKFFRVDEEMGAQIDSIRKVLKLDFNRIFCAHRPTMTDAKAALSRKLDYLENLQGMVLDLCDKGMEEKEIIRHLDKGRDLIIRGVTMGNVSFGHMVRSVLRGRA